MRKRGDAFITIHILVLVHLDVCGSLARVVVTYPRSNQKWKRGEISSLTSPIIRIVRVGVSRPLSLLRLTGDVWIGGSGLSSVAQTSSTRIGLRHTRGCPSGTSTSSTLESGISAETVLAVGVWLGHAIHLLGYAMISVVVLDLDEPQ